MPKQYSIVHIKHMFIHSSVDRHLGYSHSLAIINNTAVNTGVHVSFQISVFGFFEYIPKSETAGSYGSFNFSFLRLESFHVVVV